MDIVPTIALSHFSTGCASCPHPETPMRDDEPRRLSVAVDHRTALHCTRTALMSASHRGRWIVRVQAAFSGCHCIIHAAHELRLHSSNQSIHRDIRVCLPCQIRPSGLDETLPCMSIHLSHLFVPKKGNIDCEDQNLICNRTRAPATCLIVLPAPLELTLV